MPAEVKVLIQGCTNADSIAVTGEEKTQPTITLVKDDDFIIVVDPGVLSDQKVLIDALRNENLTVSDINLVCITHSHVDHYRNIGMFPKAKVLEYFGLWDKNTVEDWKMQFSTNIQVIKTPGHDYTGISLIVNTVNGVVAICGDVFWKENFPRDASEDAYALDPVKLEESREAIRERADWIIPGHAGMYKNDRGIEVPVKEPETPPIFGICKKCHREMPTKHDSCRCRHFLCYKCCECGIDCDLCSCSHKIVKKDE